MALTTWPSGSMKNEIGQQIGGDLVLGSQAGTPLDVAVRLDFIARLVQTFSTMNSVVPNLIGHGLGELLDMRLARRARGVVELAQHQVGEGHDEQHDDGADQADDATLAPRGGQQHAWRSRRGEAGDRSGRRGGEAGNRTEGRRAATKA